MNTLFHFIPSQKEKNQLRSIPRRYIFGRRLKSQAHQILGSCSGHPIVSVSVLSLRILGNSLLFGVQQTIHRLIQHYRGMPLGTFLILQRPREGPRRNSELCSVPCSVAQMIHVLRWIDTSSTRAIWLHTHGIEPKNGA